MRTFVYSARFEPGIGKDEKEVRRILDPRHNTKLATLTEALRELGQQLVIGVQTAA